MPGERSLLTFAVRALLVLVAVSLVWVALAGPYNRLLVGVTSPVAPDSMTIRVFDSDLLFLQPGSAPPVTLRGLTLHWGLVLVTTLVLAATGLSVKGRLVSLAALLAAVFLTHLVAVALLPRGYAWVAGPGSPSWSGTLVEGLYAVYWGLGPALIAGVWALRYWRPTARRPIPAGMVDGTRDGP